MTKADLVEKVANATGFTKSESALVCQAFLEAIKETLASGHNIEIRGFGTFKIKKRKARVARNPRTGEVVPIPDRLVPVFKPSNELKTLVMGE